jgi:N-methylhydantoinase B
LERDLALVAKDLRDGLVTIERAAQDYGVVAHGDPPQIDQEASAALRVRLRARRGRLPDVAWTPPPEDVPLRR